MKTRGWLARVFYALMGDLPDAAEGAPKGRPVWCVLFAVAAVVLIVIIASTGAPP